MLTPAKRYVREHYPEAYAQHRGAGEGWGIYGYPNHRLGVAATRRGAWEAAERHVRREQTSIGGTG